MSNNEMTLKDKLKAYTRTPGSLIVMLLVMLSAILTFAVLIFLIVYVVVHGVPYLKPSIFSLHYTSENASLMPALINTVIMTFLSLLIAVPFGIFSAIFLVEYAKTRKQIRRSHQTYDRDIAGNSIHCIWTFRNVILRNNLRVGFFHISRCIYPCNHGTSVDHAKYRRSIESRTGFIQRRKLWTWCRKTPYRIPHRTSVSGTGNPGRCDPGDRTNRRRDSSADLYSGNRCKGTK